MNTIPSHWQWFADARFGLFIHWGPYAVYGRGEQVLNREFLDQNEYARTARAWRPAHFEPAVWAAVARRAGMKYAVLTTRHHDGYCLWDTRTTDYSSVRQAAQRDFVRDYVAAFRAEGLQVGLYYSLIDFRLSAWLRGPAGDPHAWREVCGYVFEQVRELLTQYGTIDVLWFDGLWPHTGRGADFDSKGLMTMVRSLQPNILVNDRLEWPQFSYYWRFDNWKQRYTGNYLGDFGTPERGIYSDPDYLWESCQTSTSRLWGYATGEQWRTTEDLLATLIECARGGGNFLLNVGPQPDGRFPPEFVERVAAIGAWLDVHGEAIYGSERGDVSEFVTYGWQILHGNNLYLAIRYWDGRPTLRLKGLANRVKQAVLLTTGQPLKITQDEQQLVLSGLPTRQPCALYPVIRLECDGRPRPDEWGVCRTWGQPEQFASWAETRGTSVWADGKPRASGASSCSEGDR